MDGFLVIDKPAGWTSHDVVAKVRRLAAQKRVGHTGTLDPDATGVLLVCLGSTTRLIEYTDGFRKSYAATVALGVETDSQDASGVVIAQRDASHHTAADLDAMLPRFRGNIMQTPPMVSAVHHEGKRLYEIARAGGTVERTPRPVTIHQLDATNFQPGTLAHATLYVECSTGTYVRTLCADIGAALGVGGHMAALRRTKIGPYSDAGAVSLEALAETCVAAHLRSSVELLPGDWPLVECDSAALVELSHGRSIAASGGGENAAAVANEQIVAVLRRDGEAWRPVKVFPVG